MNDERLADHDVALSSVLRSFVGRFRNEILAEWRHAMREEPASAGLDMPTLMDHVPELLDHIAELADELRAGHESSDSEAAVRHVIDRLGVGYDLEELVAELSALRCRVMRVWLREHARGNGDALIALNAAVDRVIAVSAERYASARDKTLAAIDEISTAALEAGSIDELLQRLLDVFMHSTPAVDTATVLLLQGEHLVSRAAVGLEEEVASGFSLRIGEGFAGRVAAEGTPLQLRTAYLDPCVLSPSIRRRRVLALYGVPLVQDGRLIGVAHMGSLTAHEFSQEDRQLFASMTARATAGINQLLLREQLTFALAKLDGLLRASPVGIAFLDRDLRYVHVNDAIAAFNGVPAPAHLGRTVREVLPEVADQLEATLYRILQTGESLVNLELETASDERGQRRTFIANYFPVRMHDGEVVGVGGVVFELTEFRRAREELRLSEQRLHGIIEHAPAAIYVKDESGRLLVANQRAGDVLGVPRERLIGTRDVDLMPEAMARAVRANDALVLAENRAIEVEETVPAAGEPRTFLSVKFPIAGPDSRRFIGGISTDITDRKRIEDELRRAVRAREDLIAIVSHDLRNPLGTITLSATMLLMQLGEDPRTRKHLEMIQRSAGRMEHLIDDLLDTAKLQLGQLELECSVVRARDLVRDAVELHQPLAHDKGIQLFEHCDVNAELLCDRDRVLQLFGNLIGNAIKFCRTEDQIRVSCEDRDGEVTFAVSDTGPGIHPDAIPYLFDPYWSAPGHTKRGFGLGLYICKGIVTAHGGRIWVESELGAGTTFYFTLPARSDR